VLTPAVFASWFALPRRLEIRHRLLPARRIATVTRALLLAMGQWCCLIQLNDISGILAQEPLDVQSSPNRWEDEMVKTIIDPHGLFYMENAGGHKPAHPETVPSMAGEEHQPSCFALEEERGEGWKGSGALGPTINEARPSL
jgi:hypothetical protein